MLNRVRLGEVTSPIIVLSLKCLIKLKQTIKQYIVTENTFITRTMMTRRE